MYTTAPIGPGFDEQMERIVKSSRRVRMVVSQAIGVSLVDVETEHKKKQIKAGGTGRGRAVPNKWTTRTGELRRSFHRDWKPGDLEGAYGSDKQRAKHVEEGGTIRPKRRYLAIPTEHAPKKVWPRYVPDLVFIQSLRGQPLLVKPDDDGVGFRVFYILRRKVTLPPRPALARAVKATESKRDKRMNDILDREIWGRN